MKFFDLDIEFAAQTGVGAPVWCGLTNNADTLVALAIAVRQSGGRLAALWGSHLVSVMYLEIVFAIPARHLHVRLALPQDMLIAPDLSGIFPAANRMQRATHDLVGIVFESDDKRPWLRHGGWPSTWFPLSADAAIPDTDNANTVSDYPFVRVGGEGAHEIPVGPVHAGIIEPGHFRFSVVGERILRLEERLGYQHKGMEKCFVGADIAFGARLIGRVSGDSTCAYAWGYASAVEAATAITPPPRALALRAVMLERERIANHLGDLGALANDVALAFGYSQFMRLKEDWLRFNETWCGHRYLMDRIVPGGVANIDVSATILHDMLEQIVEIERETMRLHKIYEDHAGLQDRFTATGILNADQAHELSLTGFAARASGLSLDGRSARPDYTPPQPYATLHVHPVMAQRGDVAARAAVRFGEIFQSFRLLRELAVAMPHGALGVELPNKAGSGLGIIEGWRGETLVYVQIDAEGRLERVHPHDPSWQLWPALEIAVLNDIVPDFPLINKSFNLSYSGHDL